MEEIALLAVPRQVVVFGRIKLVKLADSAGERLSVFFVLIYIGVAAFTLWLAWQFVQAFTSIARSLEDIAATYRRIRTNPSSGEDRSD